MLWLWVRDSRNIKISGQGTIDGNGAAFMGRESADSYELKPVADVDPRPHVLTLFGCSNTLIHELTIRNGAYTGRFILRVAMMLSSTVSTYSITSRSETETASILII